MHKIRPFLAVYLLIHINLFARCTLYKSMVNFAFRLNFEVIFPPRKKSVIEFCFGKCSKIQKYSRNVHKFHSNTQSSSLRVEMSRNLKCLSTRSGLKVVIALCDPQKEFFVCVERTKNRIKFVCVWFYIQFQRILCKKAKQSLGKLLFFAIHRLHFPSKNEWLKRRTQQKGFLPLFSQSLRTERVDA